MSIVESETSVAVSPSVFDRLDINTGRYEHAHLPTPYFPNIQKLKNQ
jgi:hypothetical protein